MSGRQIHDQHLVGSAALAARGQGVQEAIAQVAFNEMMASLRMLATPVDEAGRRGHDQHRIVPGPASQHGLAGVMPAQLPEIMVGVQLVAVEYLRQDRLGAPGLRREVSRSSGRSQ